MPALCTVFLQFRCRCKGVWDDLLTYIYIYILYRETFAKLESCTCRSGVFMYRGMERCKVPSLKAHKKPNSQACLFQCVYRKKIYIEQIHCRTDTLQKICMHERCTHAYVHEYSIYRISCQRSGNIFYAYKNHQILIQDARQKTCKCICMHAWVACMHACPCKEPCKQNAFSIYIYVENLCLEQKGNHGKQKHHTLLAWDMHCMHGTMHACMQGSHPVHIFRYKSNTSRTDKNPRCNA